MTDRLLKEAKLAVKEQLDLHRPLVEALRDALLEREELIGGEILEVRAAAEARAAPVPAGPERPSLLARRPAPPSRWPIRAGPGRFTPEVS